MLLCDFLVVLCEYGFGILFGIVVEVFDDSVCEVFCVDKICSDQWFEVMEMVYGFGIKMMLMIMYGYVDGFENWVIYFLCLCDLQECMGGFIEFVLLFFVYMEVLIYFKGKVCCGFIF